MKKCVSISNCLRWAGVGVWLLLGIPSGVVWAQNPAPAWQNALALGQEDGSITQVEAVAADEDGNVYITADFDGTVVVGSTTLSTTSGSADVLVAKWRTNTGTWAWAVSAGAPNLDDLPFGIAVSDEAVYVTGVFQGTASFGALTLTSQGSADIFVAKLVEVGQTAHFAWVQRAGGAGFNIGRSVAVRGRSVYVSGNFSGTADFGATTLTSVGGSDAFVTKLTDTEHGARFEWAQRAGGPGSDRFAGLALNGSAVYLTGFFTGTADVGATTLTSAGGSDGWVARLTDTGRSGRFDWAQRLGGSGNDRANGIAARGPNVYVTGFFKNTADFGPTTLVSAGGVDAFVVKLTDAGRSGRFEWVQRTSGPSNEVGNAIAVRGKSVYITGFFINTISLGPVITLTSNSGRADVLVAKLTDTGPSGRFEWAQLAGGPDVDDGNALAVSGSTVYVVGGVFPPASFGSFAVASPALVVGFLAVLREGDKDGAELDRALNCYPNPAHATLRVALPILPGSASAILTVLNAQGLPVRTQQVPLPAAGETIELSLSGLPAGLYWLRVQAGGQQASRALVVE